MGLGCISCRPSALISPAGHSGQLLVAVSTCSLLQVTPTKEPFLSVHGSAVGVLQSLMAVQNQNDMSKVDEIAAQVAALNTQLRAASKEAAQISTRESLLGRPITDYSQVKQLADTFDPFLQFWSTAAAWKVRDLLQLSAT